ncbi:hypothetical protein F4677DRAFT_411174 [Hypoxylon crocopeplum]|nr:hypothetical protein F4677DRAFT_411174 [Hypoxylon crocopeplum]
MVRTRSSHIPVEDSWRMVEGGENDSFDTAIVQDPFEDDAIVFSSQSQRSEQTSSAASQDSIRDFADQADDDRVILRAPFQPSLSSTRHVSMDKDQTPVPEFFMPTIEVERQQRDRYYSTTPVRSTMKESALVRRRGNQQRDNEPTPQRYQRKQGNLPHRPSLLQRFTSSAPEFLFDTASWILGTLRMALRYAQWPLAIMLALYLSVGACMMAKDMLVNSISTPFAPLCRIPGASMINLPFCPDASSHSGSRDGSSVVEFDELMNVQAQFEKVLEDSAQGVSLPMDMKRSEASVRDLRTVVKFSDLPTRAELVHEFDNYIDIIRIGANNLQTFNTRVGSAVDSVISINRWTSRYIDSIALSREAEDNVVSRVSGWLFSPFQLSVFDERALLEKYIEHTALVSDKIANLILEAQSILRLLNQAESSLTLISEHVVHTGNVVKEKQNQVFWNIWTLVGGNARRLHNLRGQLSLLQQVETQRNSAVKRLDSLVLDLYDIQTKLSDLRDRVATPELVADTTTIPLSVHIETINAGVERLEAARSRIRAEENERLQQALERSREDHRLIDG